MLSSPEPLVVERRARSASPSKKNRHEGYRLGTHSLCSFDDILSTNGSVFDRVQWKELAKSPLSKKIHVSAGPLGSPIPFQLQLPPRLSKSMPSSPEKHSESRFPTKMIFNGQTYEPYFSDDQSLDEESSASPNRLLQAVPATTEKPPSLGNRKKVAKFAEKNNVFLLHQLSMIRELSLRVAKAKAASPNKKLPPSPTGEDSIGSDVVYLENLSAPQTPKVQVMSTSHSQPLMAPKPTQPTSTNFSNIDRRMDVTPESQVFLESLHAEQKPRQSNGHEASGIIQSHNDTKPLRLPNSAAFHHDLFMSTDPPFKIDKRAFSEESTVSSFSSFSSVGEAFIRGYQASPAATEPKLVQGISSQYSHSILGPHPPQLQSSMTNSKRAFIAQNTTRDNSMQFPHVGQKDTSMISQLVEKKVLKPSVSFNSNSGSASPISKEMESHTQSSFATLTLDEVFQSENVPGTIEISQLPASDALVVKSPQIECTQSSLESSIDDNRGAGMSFNFPNDGLNMTNSETTKIRAFKTRNPRKSFLGYMTPQGQIEIPKLCDESPLKRKNNASILHSFIFDEIPSTHIEQADDSDSESSFNSQFSMLQAKKFQPTHIPASKSMGAIPASPTSNSSPVRHIRQRSMFNIDTAGLDLNISPHKPKPQVVTSLGPSFIDSMKLASKTRNETPEKSDLVEERETTINDESHDIPFVVSEPPKRVEYAIDFKSTNSHSRTTRSTYSNRLRDLNVSLPSVSAHGTQSASETNSSYKSSRSGVETASTAASETESVTIDLTKEKYDVCLVKRQDSTLSYKSVIEHQEGKKVEVVLVDDDDENSNDRDDLLSIYSRYMGGWSKEGIVKQNLTTKETTDLLLQRQRKLSVASTTSEDSDNTINSWAAGSTSNFKVKSLPIKAPLLRPPPMLKESRPTVFKRGIPPRRKAPESPEWQDIDNDEICDVVSKKSIRDDHSYFDYSQGGRYDFDSYMRTVK